jgi:lipopolysaccharide assembly outer membrane protein LptD (OstA)
MTVSVILSEAKDLDNKKIMKKLTIITLILFFFVPITIGISKSCAIETPDYSADEPIECDGDKVEYFEAENKVVGSGNVVIKYKDIELTSDKVTVRTDTYAVLAEGNVTLTQGESIFRGALIEYDFKNSTGKVVDFSGEAEEWYVKGEDAERVSEEKFIVKRSYATTCSHKVPHWKISAGRIEVYPEKMINTYNAVAWINPLAKEGMDIPLMWIPYYCHPLDDNRPQVTLVPGKSSDWGYYLLSAWRYHLSPNQKGYIHIDYREKKDLALGLDYIYDTKVIGKGNMSGYSVNERGMKNNYLLHKWFHTGSEYDEYKSESEKYITRLRHQWQASNDTLVTAELHKYADQNVIKDYFYDDYEKDEHPLTYVLATHSMKFGVLSFLTQKRVNDFDQITEMLPEAKLDIYNQQIGNSKFYYKGNFKAVNMNKVYPKNVDNAIDSQHANMLDSYNQLSYQAKVGFLSVTPYAGTKQTFLDRQVDDSKSIINGAAYSGVDISTKFYKVFDTHFSPFGIELNKLRHVLTPTFGYQYIADPTQDADKMLSDGVSKSNIIGLGLENKLQTKRGSDEAIVDLAMLLINTTYDLTRVSSGSQFGDFTGKLELRPYDWLTATSDAVVDVHQRSDHRWLKQINNNLSMNFDNKGSLGIGHSYQAGANSVIAQAKLDSIPGWKFSGYWDFDFLATRDNEKMIRKFREQEYIITKDLHCWEADVRYNISKDDGHEIMLIFRLKAFPDVPFRFGKTYNRPKVGAQSN